MHILTFDVEEWFHLLDHEETSDEKKWDQYESRIERNINLILDCLAEAQLKATFFCLGWIAETHPGVIRAIHAAGHEIGSHSNSHRLIYRLSPRQFQDDLSSSIKSLEDITGVKVRAYRSPGFSITQESMWAWSILAENGIEFDSSIFASKHSHGGIPNFPTTGPIQLDFGGGMTLKQFPILPGKFCGCTVNFAGGGYFRLLPYPIVRLLMGRARYAMTYFHPRDFDANQPLVQNLPVYRMFKSYVGLRSCLRKFKKLLREFDFVDLATADSMIDWTVQPRMRVGAH